MSHSVPMVPIHEVIVITTQPSGEIHIAPMGIVRAEPYVYIAPFCPSTTYENLQQTGQAVINSTVDVRVFAGCLTGRAHWPTVPLHTVPGHRLQAALSHEAVRVVAIEEDPVRPRCQCEIIEKVHHAPFSGFNRAQAAVLEAAILVSRLDRLPQEKVATELAYLQIAIDKTAGEEEQQAWSWLLDRVAQYRVSKDVSE